MFMLTFNTNLVGPNSLLSKLGFPSVLFSLGSKRNRSSTWFIMIFMKDLFTKLCLNSETKTRKYV